MMELVFSIIVVMVILFFSAITFIFAKDFTEGRGSFVPVLLGLFTIAGFVYLAACWFVS